MPDQLNDLPLFPLGLVLYPNERLPLHIFEPRYKEMIGRCLQGGEPFGIVLVQDGSIARVGCTARVAQVLQRYEDGRLDVLVSGERRFRLRRVMDTHSYLSGEVELLPEPEVPLVNDDRERVITQHMKLLELAGRTVQPSLYQDNPQVSFFIAHNAGLSLEQKQAVLELPSENDRIQFLVQYLEDYLPHVEEREDVRRRVRSNGHFKDFPALGDAEG